MCKQYIRVTFQNVNNREKFYSIADLNQSERLKRVSERPSSKIFLGEDVLERNLDRQKVEKL